MNILRSILLSACFLISFSAVSQISFVNGSSSYNISATSITPTEPTSTAENDVVIAFCSIHSEDSTWTDPSDFTQIDNQATAHAGIESHSYIGYKVRASDAGSGYQFDYTGGTADDIKCTLSSWRGVDASVLDVTYVKASHYNETDQDAAATAAQPITTNTNNAWVILHQYTWENSHTGGAPTNYTLNHESDSQNAVHHIASREITSAGTETPGGWNHTDVQAAADSYNYTLALQPASSNSSLRRRR